MPLLLRFRDRAAREAEAAGGASRWVYHYCAVGAWWIGLLWCNAPLSAAREYFEFGTEIAVTDAFFRQLRVCEVFPPARLRLWVGLAGVRITIVQWERGGPVCCGAMPPFRPRANVSNLAPQFAVTDAFFRRLRVCEVFPPARLRLWVGLAHLCITIV